MQNRVQAVNLLLDNGAQDNIYSDNLNQGITNLEDSIDEEFSLKTSAEFDRPKHKKLALNKVMPLNERKKTEKEKSGLNVQGMSYTVHIIVYCR